MTAEEQLYAETRRIIVLVREMARSCEDRRVVAESTVLDDLANELERRANEDRVRGSNG